jgi:hypothetical protein
MPWLTAIEVGVQPMQLVSSMSITCCLLWALPLLSAHLQHVPPAVPAVDVVVRVGAAVLPTPQALAGALLRRLGGRLQAEAADTVRASRQQGLCGSWQRMPCSHCM